MIWGRILTSLGLGSLICERGLLIVPATGASLVSWLRLAFHLFCGKSVGCFGEVKAEGGRSKFWAGLPLSRLSAVRVDICLHS